MPKAFYSWLTQPIALSCSYYNLLRVCPLVGTITDIIEYRFALRKFVERDLTVRYKRSFFGFLWSLLNPLLMILTFIIVFKYLWGIKEDNYSAKLFTTLLAWRFFNQAVMDGSATVGSKLSLLKQVHFPPILLPLSSLIALMPLLQYFGRKSIIILSWCCIISR